MSQNNRLWNCSFKHSVKRSEKFVFVSSIWLWNWDNSLVLSAGVAIVTSKRLCVAKNKSQLLLKSQMYQFAKKCGYSFVFALAVNKFTASAKVERETFTQKQLHNESGIVLEMNRKTLNSTSIMENAQPVSTKFFFVSVKYLK